MAEKSITLVIRDDESYTENLPTLDYTWLISGVLYLGGGERLLAALHERGINECFFHNVAGSPIGKKVIAGGLSESFDVEIFNVVVAADQADTVFDMIYHLMDMDQPNRGIMRMERLMMSTVNVMPQEVPEENQAA